MQKTKSVGVNKTAKVEVHITDYQSWNSCRKVASDHEFTFGSAIESTKKISPGTAAVKWLLIMN